jgi:aminopeptidase N
MMEYFAALFGEYPFLTEKYAIAMFDHPGAMEHQTATSMGANWVDGTNANDWVVCHELSHSWVGDMITMPTWDHAWCKEGFATYCEALWFEDQYGTDYYHDYMESMNVMQYAENQIFGIDPPLHSTIYRKGAWVLHMLRHVIGDVAFFEGAYAYTNNPDYRYGVADTEDLRSMFEGTSGMDLVWFFDEWIYSPGYPIYEYDWSATPAAMTGFDVDLEITQTQTVGPVFKMPIDVRIATDLGPETFVVWDSLATQAFTLHVDGTPTGLALDPDNWIIKEVTTVGAPEAAPASGFMLAQNRPNPFHPTTRIRYDLDRPGPATLVVFDAGGRRVVSLVDAVLPAGPGSVSWDGRDARGRSAAPGVYYYRLMLPGGAGATRRMVLVR